jgi:dihydrofolate reductase
MNGFYKNYIFFKPREPPQGAHFLAQSLNDALKLIEEPELANKVDMVWIVGGSSVYKVSKV